MRDEHDGRVGRAAPPVDEVRDDLLVGQVEGEQRLVAEQHRGVADQRLRHPQPLLLAAGEPSDRGVGVVPRPHRLQRRPHPFAAHGPAAQPDAEAVAVEAEADEVAGAQRQVLRERLLLRHVADGLAAARGRLPPDQHLPRVQRLQPQEHPQQRGLAGSVGAQHGEELTGRDVEVEALPQGALAEAQCGAAQRDRCRAHPGRHVGHHASNAAASASTWPFIQTT